MHLQNLRVKQSPLHPTFKECQVLNQPMRASLIAKVALLQEVESKFSKYGDVRVARIVRNPYNGESRGFGFVEMADDHGTDKV